VEQLTAFLLVDSSSLRHRHPTVPPHHWKRRQNAYLGALHGATKELRSGFFKMLSLFVTFLALRLTTEDLNSGLACTELFRRPEKYYYWSGAASWRI